MAIDNFPFHLLGFIIVNEAVNDTRFSVNGSRKKTARTRESSFYTPLNKNVTSTFLSVVVVVVGAFLSRGPTIASRKKRKKGTRIIRRPSVVVVVVGAFLRRCQSRATSRLPRPKKGFYRE